MKEKQPQQIETEKSSFDAITYAKIVKEQLDNLRKIPTLGSDGEPKTRL